MSRRGWLALAALAGLAYGLRAGALEAALPLRLLGDEVYYAQVAAHIAEGRGHVYVGRAEGEAWAWRPPLHPWLLSLFVDAQSSGAGDPAQSPELLLPLARLQVALGALLVALTGLLGRALFDERTGLLAAGIAALDPALIAHSHYLWSENLFAVLVTAGLLGAAAVQRRPTLPRALATGAAFGLAALSRELALPVAAACAAWWCWMAEPAARGRALALGACTLLSAAVLLSPWTWRNYQMLGRFVPVSTVGWFALAEGNTLESPHWMAREGPEQLAFHQAYFSTRGEVARLDLARAHALARIEAEQPAWLGKKLVRSLALLLNPDSVLRTKLRHGAYGDRPGASARLLLAASIPAYLALVVAATLGIASAPAQGRRALACLVLGVVALLHVLSNATPRFRVPWLPLLAVYASHALLHPRGLPARAGGPALAAAGAFLAFFFCVCVPYYYLFGPRP
jgi:hypothetical protein